jgi:hypothetical protein
VRVLVTGSRKWPYADVVWRQLDSLYRIARIQGSEDFTVVHGACPRGADLMASMWCRAMHDSPVDPIPRVIEERHPAKWRVDGVLNRRAGFERNTEMAEAGADWCLAFHKDGSGGTAHMISEARRCRISVAVYTPESIDRSSV